MDIPITQLVDSVAFFALIFVTVRLWKRSFQQKTIPLFLFASAFLSILLMMGMFALPFAIAQYPSIGQIMFYIADLMFMVAVAFFAAVTIVLVFPANRTLLIVLPGVIGIIGLSVFLWQMFNPIIPMFPVEFFAWGDVALINYQNSASIVLRIIQGSIAVCVFLVGAFLFFRQMYSMQGAIRVRASLLGSGYATAAAAVVANYIVGAFPDFQGFAFLTAAFIALASVLCIYRAVCVRVANMLDKEEGTYQ